MQVVSPLTIGILSGGALLVLSLGSTVFCNWRIHPVVTEWQKKAGENKSEAEGKLKNERQKKLE